MTDFKKRVLILGGGFGGVYVAVHLGKLLSKKERERAVDLAQEMPDARARAGARRARA
jgi:NADH dehydrogenase FAD-containing subunit